MVEMGSACTSLSLVPWKVSDACFDCVSGGRRIPSGVSSGYIHLLRGSGQGGVEATRPGGTLRVFEVWRLQGPTGRLSCVRRSVPAPLSPDPRSGLLAVGGTSGPGGPR